MTFTVSGKGFQRRGLTAEQVEAEFGSSRAKLRIYNEEGGYKLVKGRLVTIEGGPIGIVERQVEAQQRAANAPRETREDLAQYLEDVEGRYDEAERVRTGR